MKRAKNAQKKHQTATFDAVLRDWLRTVQPRLKAGSYATYAGIVDSHLLPDLGKLSPEELDAPAVGKYLTGLQARYAPATVQAVGTVLRMALRHGEDMGYTVPQFTPVKGLPARGGRILTEPERRRLERFLLEQESPMALGTLLALYTGLRLGELCALTWGDLDREAQALTVRRTLLRVRQPQGSVPKTALVFSTPKSASSRRIIPIPGRLQGLLERCRREDGFFLLSGAPEPTDPRTVQVRFKKYLRQAGIRDINFHALRHTFATRCVSLGFDPKTISAILGHADVSMTLNRYVHPSLKGMRACIDQSAVSSYYKI